MQELIAKQEITLTHHITWCLYDTKKIRMHWHFLTIPTFSTLVQSQIPLLRQVQLSTLLFTYERVCQFFRVIAI